MDGGVAACSHSGVLFVIGWKSHRKEEQRTSSGVLNFARTAAHAVNGASNRHKWACNEALFAPSNRRQMFQWIRELARRFWLESWHVEGPGIL